MPRHRDRSDSDTDGEIDADQRRARRVKFDKQASSSPDSSPPPQEGKYIHQPGPSTVAAPASTSEEPKVLALYAPYANQLSAACYDPEERKVHVLEDTKDTYGWDLATLLLEQIQPDLVMMSGKAPESLIEKVTSWCEERSLDPEIVISMQPSNVFNRTHATWALSAIKLPDVSAFKYWLQNRPEPEDGSDDTLIDHMGIGGDAGMGRRMAMVKMGCRVNFDAVNTVCVTGALVYHVQAGKKVLELQGLQTMSLDQHMIINQDALTSLAILDTESHAFMHNQAQKQSLTLFGLLNTCVTPLGKKLLHTWHLRPITDIGQIAARHDAIDMLVYPGNQFPVDLIKRAMKQVGNVSGLCMKIRKNRGTWRDWKRIMDALLATLEVKNKLNEIGHGTHLPIVERIDKHINEDINLFCTYISQIIDYDASAADDRISVRAGIDDELDQWRSDYASLDSVLSQITMAVLQPTMIRYRMGSEVNAVYFPQLGHLAVLTDRNMSVEIPPYLKWELRFTTGNQQYFKTPEMENMDEHFGDIHTKIINKEIEYADRMAEAVKMVEGTITGAVEAIAELDCLLALATASQQYHLVKPIMTDRPVLEIVEGRHLIQEQLVQAYVTNDTLLLGGHQEDEDSGLNSMMIVTGANGSGKSAYGKQVALIAFMAQIGSFVPATNATIGVVDKIYTRVQTRESASKPASAFMIDLAQVSLALRGATSRSLIILDEFGKGTTSGDGAGLLAGVVDYLIHEFRPRCVILTHFHELFANSLIPDELPIIQAHMKTITTMSDDSRVTFLYKLTPTHCLSSMAAECAKHHGIPREIVDRARFVTECVSKYELHKIYDTQLTPEQADELAVAEAVVRAFVTWDISPESIDVGLQVREMLERCELEVNEALERDEGEEVEVDEVEGPVLRFRGASVDGGIQGVDVDMKLEQGDGSDPEGSIRRVQSDSAAVRNEDSGEEVEDQIKSDHSQVN